jgi:catechol 2,3-dioxygenase-like lactoylglutathione lyase family enzyme
MADWTSTSTPRLSRFRMATMGAPDLDQLEHCYVEWLGYRVRERGAVSPDLAIGWGAAGMAGRRYLILSSDGADDVHIRAVETDAIPGYRPLTSFGWNACEIIVDDVHALAARLRESPFEIIDGPNPLQFMPSIEAMQLIGPAGECLYLTMEGGDRTTSILPSPRAAVDRPFILVVAGADFAGMHRWYIDRFDLRQRPIRDARVRIIQRAQGLAEEESFPLTTLGLAEHGFLIELDGYLTGSGRIAAPRATAPDMLPMGNAMASFEIDDIALVEDIALAPPVSRHGLGYDGGRSCTVIGPAGELVELIERQAR